MLRGEKPYDPDDGLTWEEKIERRLKEAQQKIKELKEIIKRERAEEEKWTLEITRLEKLLKNHT